jgi:ABC-type multidrug transport system ATPase subunit
MRDGLLLEVQDVSKNFGALAALVDVSFTVRAGEVFSVIGPNGAGKSTLFNVISGLHVPTAGRVVFQGTEITGLGPEVINRRGLAKTFQITNIFPGISVYDNMRVAAQSRAPISGRLPSLWRRPDVEGPVMELLGAFGLTARRDDLAQHLSHGEQRYLEICLALATAPALLLLDEPTVGLDPQAARDLRERVVQLRDEGRTVLLTTHYMEEADQLCDRIAIVDHGRIVALDTPEGLKRNLTATEVVRLELHAPEEADAGLVARVEAGGTIAQRDRSNGTLHLTVHCDSARELVPLVIDAARAEAAELANIQVQPVSLEDVFISLTGRALRE